jgi:hypothetical protein
MTGLNEWQRTVARISGQGSCDVGLTCFLLRQLSTESGCADLDTALERINCAMSDLELVEAELEKLRTPREKAASIRRS